MTTRKEFQDIATNTYSKVWSNCDPAVREAIEKFHAAVTPSHSFTSKKFSLTSLIAGHLDEVIKTFMLRFLSEEPKLLSNLVKFSLREADDYFVKAMKEYDAFARDWKVDKRGDIIRATIDSLRNLVQFCEFNVSEDVTYVCADDDLMLRKKRTKKRGISRKESTRSLLSYLRFKHRPYCKFCDQLTERAIEYYAVKNEVVIEALENKEIKLVTMLKKDIGNFRVIEEEEEGKKDKDPGYSPTYCALHNPSVKKSNYNRALQKNKQFYSLMRLLIDIPRQVKIRPFDEHELRVVAYLLLEKYPIKKDISQAATSVADYYEKEDTAEKKAALIEMARLYESFMKWHYKFLSLQKNTGGVFILPTL